EQDLREAREALDRLERRLSQAAHDKLAKEQERLRADTERLAKDVERVAKGASGVPSGLEELGKAQNEMDGAERSLKKGDRAKALPREEAAKRELESAKEKLEALEREVKRLIELPDYEKLAQNQEGTTETTEELLEKLRGQAPPGGDGQAPPAPGENGVEGAKKAMERASKNLRGRSARGANNDQREALDRLEKAKEELEEALRQLREEMQLMLLDALERRLAKMLQEQERMFRETVSLHLRLRDAKTPAASDQDKARQLGDGEAELSAEAEKLLGVVREEGTTVVIPDVVEDLKGDLDALAARLRRIDAGEYTQRIQQDVIETLRQLIRVIQEERERRQGGDGGGEGMEGDQEEDLLPTSAELKMLREMQVRVNKRTEEFERMVAKEEGERARIAEKQRAVGSLTRSMADKLNKQENR
ncbi:MAG: hypothetical protein ACREID_08345, partial [Planctomycetota bacterium]